MFIPAHACSLYVNVLASCMFSDVLVWTEIIFKTLIWTDCFLFVNNSLKIKHVNVDMVRGKAVTCKREQMFIMIILVL